MRMTALARPAGRASVALVVAAPSSDRTPARSRSRRGSPSQVGLAWPRTRSMARLAKAGGRRDDRLYRKWRRSATKIKRWLASADFEGELRAIKKNAMRVQHIAAQQDVRFMLAKNCSGQLRG